MTDSKLEQSPGEIMAHYVHRAIDAALLSENGAEFGLQAAYRALDHNGRDIFATILINRYVHALGETHITRLRLEIEKLEAEAVSGPAVQPG